MNNSLEIKFDTMLDPENNVDISRPNCREIIREIKKGKTFNYTDLTEEVLTTLCVEEDSPNGLIAALFNTSRDMVQVLKNIYGIRNKKDRIDSIGILEGHDS